VGHSGNRPIRWSLPAGILDLDPVGVAFPSHTAHAASQDGSVIVGYGVTGIQITSFRWTVGGGIVLFDPSAPFDIQATDISADGQAIVGHGASGGATGSHWRWTSSGGWELIIPSTLGRVDAVSADGNTVTGETFVVGPMDFFEAFRWTPTTGAKALDGFDLGWFEHTAGTGISADGSTVVGTLGLDFEESGFLHMQGSSELVDLGDLVGGEVRTMPTDVSGDGAIVVGRSRTADGWRAFIWDATNGMRELSSVLSGYGVDLTGWTLVNATAISDDGLVIAGIGTNPGGQEEGWVVVLDETVPQVPALSLLALLLLGASIAGIGLRFQQREGVRARTP
jgi:hypothetical protein